MSQNYSELRKNNVRDAIYEDVANNLEVLRTSWSGDAFPANPKVGQPCYRTDEDKLYYWDGYKWSQKGGGGSAELKTMELPAIETERVSIILEGARCLDKNMMFVFVDKIAQDPSTYSMNDDGTVVNFDPAIPANAAVTLRWFDTDVGTFDTAIFASDAEFAAGELTNKAPNVKQVHSFGDQIQTSNANYVKSEFQSNLLNYTTNRILEIPQDIKLELSSDKRTITLKAGSKLYQGNGTVINVGSDKSLVWNYTNPDVFLIAYYSGALGIALGSETVSTPPTQQSTSDFYIKYCTSDSIIYYQDNVALRTNMCFPLAKMSVNDGVFTVNQVFNGFGYIGSTIFALPGIKVQGAFGVNEDGTYRLKTFETDHILTESSGSDVNGRYTFGFDVTENGTYTYFGSYANEPKVSETQPSGTNFAWWNPIKGETLYVNNSGIVEGKPYIPSRLGWINISGGKIDSMTRNPTDSIVTSNALNFSQAGRSYLSGLGMPSGRYIDLTLGASGSTYTAPANGYMYLGMTATAANQYININDGQGLTNVQNAIGSGNYLDSFVAFKKGDVGSITYNAGTLRAFRFYYAEGEN